MTAARRVALPLELAGERVERERGSGNTPRQLELGLARGELQLALRPASPRGCPDRPAKPGTSSRARSARSVKRAARAEAAPARRTGRSIPVAQSASRPRGASSSRWPAICGGSGSASTRWRSASRSIRLGAEHAAGLRPADDAGSRSSASPARAPSPARGRAPTNSTPSAQLRALHAAAQRDQLERRELVAEARAHVGERHVGGASRIARPFCSVAHTRSAPCPCAHVDRIVDPRRATRRGRCSRARGTRARSTRWPASVRGRPARAARCVLPSSAGGRALRPERERAARAAPGAG